MNSRASGRAGAILHGSEIYTVVDDHFRGRIDIVNKGYSIVSPLLSTCSLELVLLLSE